MMATKAVGDLVLTHPSQNALFGGTVEITEYSSNMPGILAKNECDTLMTIQAGSALSRDAGQANLEDRGRRQLKRCVGLKPHLATSSGKLN